MKHEKFHYSNLEDILCEAKKANVDIPLSRNTDILWNELKGPIQLRNRFAIQPMEGCDAAPDGSPGELTLRRYGRFAKSGAGLIWAEAVAIQTPARAKPRQLRITEDNMSSYKAMVENIKETTMKLHGFEPVVIMQAAHSGRYSNPNGYSEPIIAYSNPLFEKEKPIDRSRIITDSELERLEEDYGWAAKMAQNAGFDGVDIKACHRYLCSELLSAYNRPGKYGGSFDNRTRLLRNGILSAKASTHGDFLVTTRLNVYDGFPYPYGFGVNAKDGLMPDMTEPLKLVEILHKELGLSLINISIGNPYVNPHVNRPFVLGGYKAEEHPLQGVQRMLGGIAQLKALVPEMKVISSAMTYLGVAAPQVAAGYIEAGGFDIAGFGRTIFAYPDFAREILKNGAMDKNKICICCSKCTEIMRKPGGTPGCVIRDAQVYKPLHDQLVRGV